MNEREKAQKQIAQQADFIEILCQRFQTTLKKSMQEEPTMPWHPVANKTQLCADARRIRRELMEFIKIIEEGAR